MVKFSKELEAQLIPEWKDAFVDYRQLKKQVKKMKLSFEDSEEENAFFDKLDWELNKVNQFYKSKESEFLERWEILKKITSDPRKPDMQNEEVRIDIPEAEIVKKDSKKTQKMIREAFLELYRGLGLLKKYRSLNMTAFAKILKKFDKVSNQKVAESYLKQVKGSRFSTCDSIVKVMDELEITFTNKFSNSDRKEAMKCLRPQEHKESHMITFFVGLSTGCLVSLLVVYAMIAHLSGIFSTRERVDGYIETVYPVFSVFVLLSLHLFMYGCNLFMWKNLRINQNFVFEFSPKTALRYRDAFFMCSTLMTAVVGGLLFHLVLRSSGNFPSSQIDVIPGVFIVFLSAILICPFDLFYRSTRYCFLRILCNIVFSPFCKVLMVDIFMADQFTSQVPVFRHLESVACFFAARVFKTHRYETCQYGRPYLELAYVISFSPYYWRAMQCARRWYDERDADHLANMGKYVSAMVAAGARITYSRQPESHLWFGVVIVTSVVATVYQLYWDFVKDWGLINNPKSFKSLKKLRDDLIFKNKRVYYISMAINVVLRIAWVETVMPFRIASIVELRFLDLFLASLEVIRRGHWNFYKLENEHLSNVRKFRAVKTVPLPFR